MGGKPSKGTSADKRLAANKPGAAKPASKPATGAPGSWSSQNKPKPTKKGQ